MTPPVLTVSGLSKAFGAVNALADVSFSVHPGTVTALLGDNGAGKSTLIKCLSGIHPWDQGSVSMAGVSMAGGHPHESTRLGMRTVYQDLALCDDLDVVANLFLGNELHAFGFLAEDRMEREALRLLDELGVRVLDLHAPVSALSGGQRQGIAVARALLSEARLIMMDEPTAALGTTQAHQVLELIRRLRARGLAIILISHNLQDVFAVADHLLVLRQGHKVGAWPISHITPQQVVAAITGADLAAPTLGH